MAPTKRTLVQQKYLKKILQNKINFENFNLIHLRIFNFDKIRQSSQISLIGQN